MFKVMVIGKNRIRAYLAENDKIITFSNYKAAESYIERILQADILPDNYSLEIEKMSS
ncbi:lipid-A-disaccharide synthase [Oceanobacillus picturae]|uniref:Lipid-A-disaccharide synthase n=1 Tax=Oceanobacillus picturae TaxID=171693 RepID=W9BFJ4_9BACI|nr:hypothetical protein [Oceanobacillus picturae]GAQ17144.1 lipid-A-disaccharide synthase [Oceanobacillus picturae]CDO05125.1 hypothetical protein BN988_03709 [Oceanobacillus picturae]